MATNAELQWEESLDGTYDDPDAFLPDDELAEREVQQELDAHRRRVAGRLRVVQVVEPSYDSNWADSSADEEFKAWARLDAVGAYLADLRALNAVLLARQEKELLNAKEERVLTDKVFYTRPLRKRLAAFQARLGEGYELTLEEEAEMASLAPEVADSEQAARYLVEANLRLVVDIAKRYRMRGAEMSDLIAEGNTGLIYAVFEKFDPSAGYRLSTYATQWIRKAIGTYLTDRSRAIRIPAHRVWELRRIDKAEARLWAELGREPTDEELAEGAGMGTDELREIRLSARQPISLNGPVRADEDNEIGEFVEDLEAPDGGELASVNDLKQRLSGALMRLLAPRERRVVMLLMGMVDGQQRTKKEIAQRLGVTVGVVRQLESSATQRLKDDEEVLELWQAWST